MKKKAELIQIALDEASKIAETGGTDNSLSDPKISLKVLEKIIDDLIERSLTDEELFYLYTGIVDNPNATVALIRSIAYSPRVEGEIDGLAWSDIMYEPILPLFWALMANKHTSGGILRNFANIQNFYWRKDFAERVIDHPNVWDETLAEIAENEGHSEKIREQARAKLNKLASMAKALEGRDCGIDFEELGNKSYRLWYFDFYSEEFIEQFFEPSFIEEDGEQYRLFRVNEQELSLLLTLAARGLLVLEGTGGNR